MPGMKAWGKTFSSLFSVATLFVASFSFVACSSLQDQPKFKLSDDQGNLNQFDQDQPLLKLWLAVDYWDESLGFWDGVVFATLTNPRHPQLGRLSDNSSYGSELELWIGEEKFHLRVHASKNFYQLVPAATSASLISDFDLPEGNGYRILDWYQYEELFQKEIQLRKSGGTQNLILGNQSASSPQSVFPFSSDVYIDRFISNCDTDQITWNGASSGRLLMSFHRNYFSTPNSPESGLYNLADTGASSEPLEGGDNIFERLFPNIDLSIQSALERFERSATRNIVKRELSLLNSPLKLSMDLKAQEISGYDIMYTNCSFQ